MGYAGRVGRVCPEVCFPRLGRASCFHSGVSGLGVSGFFPRSARGGNPGFPPGAGVAVAAGLGCFAGGSGPNMALQATAPSLLLSGFAGLRPPLPCPAPGGAPPELGR